MKARHRCKTTDVGAKSKLGCNKIESLKPGKYTRKSSGKVDAKCIEDLLPVQSYPPSQLLFSGSSFTEAPFSNSNNLSGRPPNLSGKIKLQLFPIDAVTQNFLQQEKHNPYLELTLAPRKKISSIVQHLNTKWGTSQCASGELMLFPYNATLDSIVSSKKWTLKDSCITAADVYVAIGSPSKFRLRYGWCGSKIEEGGNGASLASLHSMGKIEREAAMPHSNKTSDPVLGGPKQMVHLNALSSNFAAPSVEDNTIQAVDNQSKVAPLSWIDCVSNMSFGALLSEALPSQDGNPLPSQNNLSLQQGSVNCDSFDAAIASLIACQQTSNQPKESPPSLWDAEETCHAFSFQNRTSLSSFRTSGSAQGCSTPTTSSILCAIPESGRVGNQQASLTGEGTECQKKETNAQALALSKNDHNDCGKPDISQPESSSEPEPSTSCSRLMGGTDSLGLGSLLSNSLDIFQNFSVF